MGAVVKEQFAPAQWIEIKAVQTDGARFMNDDRVVIGESGDLVSHTIREQGCAIPVGILTHLCS